MSVEELEHLKEILMKAFEEAPDTYGIIVYIFERDVDGCDTGFYQNANIVDAISAIKRIAEAFGIALYTPPIPFQ